jgi:hypothetical protein
LSIITNLLWTTLLFGLSIYLLAGSINGTDPTAEPRALIGGLLLAAAFFRSLFIIRRYLLARRLERHVKGKAGEP